MRRAVFIAAAVVLAPLWLGLLALVFSVGTGTLKAYGIPSSAMEPTLHCARPAPGCEAGWQDRVLVLTRLESYGRGDLVAFRAPPEAVERCGAGGTFVKRIVGLPGETVEIRLRRGRAYVLVDGEELDEPYVEQERRDVGPEETFRVPDGSYFLLGDNRSQSCDSRVFGPVEKSAFVGRLVATYWPPSRFGIR